MIIMIFNSKMIYKRNNLFKKIQSFNRKSSKMLKLFKALFK